MADDTEQKQPQEIASTTKAKAKSSKTKKDESTTTKAQSPDTEDLKVDDNTSSKKTRKKPATKSDDATQTASADDGRAKAEEVANKKEAEGVAAKSKKETKADSKEDPVTPPRKKRGRPRMTEEEKAAAAAARKKKAAAKKAAKAEEELKSQATSDETDESNKSKTEITSQDTQNKSSAKTNSKRENKIEENKKAQTETAPETKSDSSQAEDKDTKSENNKTEMPEAPKKSSRAAKKSSKTTLKSDNDEVSSQDNAKEDKPSSDEAEKAISESNTKKSSTKKSQQKDEEKPGDSQVEDNTSQKSADDIQDGTEPKKADTATSSTKATGPTRRRRTVTRRKKTVEAPKTDDAKDEKDNKGASAVQEPVVYTEDEIALLIKKATEAKAASGIMPAPSQVLPELSSQGETSEAEEDDEPKAKKQEVTRTRTAATRTKTVRRRVVRRTIKKKDSDEQATSAVASEAKIDEETKAESGVKEAQSQGGQADLNKSRQSEELTSEMDAKKEQPEQDTADNTSEATEDKGVQRRKRVVRSVKIEKPQKNQANGRRQKKNSNSGMEPSLTKEELKEMKVAEIREKARELDLDPTGIRKAELIELVYDAAAYAEGFRTCKGVLEIQADGYGFIRSENYMQGKDDAFVYNQLIRQYGLRSGDEIEGTVVPARSAKNYPPVQQILAINGRDPELARKRPRFKDLTPVYPNERLIMEHGKSSITGRAIDLVAPIGKGQRGLIVSPPKAGKTTILKKICQSIAANNPEVHLICLLVDERPEEVTDMQRSIKGEVVASTFDMPPENHTTVSELVIERAKRLVEQGEDVVVVLDSITRLARAYNLAEPASGRILSGGVDSAALYPPKRFLGAARNIENGGSLTILASALVDTGSKMDEVIFEEFKGTGNMELKLDRDLANRRIYPAIDPVASGTRNEDLLLEEVERSCVWGLRRTLVGFNNTERAATMLIKSLKETPNNKVFLLAAAKKSQNVDFSEQQS